MNHKPWQAIFDKNNIEAHNFSKKPYVLTAEQIKKATSHFQQQMNGKSVFCANRIHGKTVPKFL